MKVLLVYPDILPSIRDYKGYFNVGISSIAAVLKKEGHQVCLLHLVSKPLQMDVIECVSRIQPDIVGISSTSNQFLHAKLVAGWIRRAFPKMLIVSGGIHSILNADQVVRMDEFSMVCIGEGEHSMASLAGKLQRGEDEKSAPGMMIRREDQRIQINPLPPVIDNLDELPWPSRDIWNYESLHMESSGIASVMFSRGCPRACTYCCNRTIAGIYRGHGMRNYFRIRSVDSTIAELSHLKARYPFVRMFNFDDDNLFMNIGWSREFTERYRREIALPFSCNLYPGMITKERVELLRKAGCVDLRIGLESGNEELRKKVLGRDVSNERIRTAYRLCKEMGLKTRSFLMVGLPGETPGMILDTIKFVADEKVGIAQTSIYYPYKGTALYDYAVARGYADTGIQTADDYYSGSILQSDNFWKEQIKMFRSYIPVFVMLYRFTNRLPSFISRKARRMLDRILLIPWLPRLLNPAIGAIGIIKVLLPERMNINRMNQGHAKTS